MQPAGDLDEHAVARAVPERVVDLLEVVEVEQHEAAVVPGLERERDVLAEGEPVVRARHDIGARLLLGLHAQRPQLGVGGAQLVDARLQTTLELAAVADIEHEAEPHVAPVSGVVGDVAIEHPALDAVIAHEAVGGLELRAVPVALRGESEDVVLVVDVDEVEPLAARGVSVDDHAAREALAVGARADRHPLAGLVLLEYVDVCVDGLEHMLELGLAGRQSGRRGPARGDVRRDPDDLDRSARQLLALGALAHPARDAVGAAQAELDARTLARHLRGHERLVGDAVLGVHRGHPVLGVLVCLDAAKERVAVRALVGLVVGALFVEPARVEVLLELDQQPLDRLRAHEPLVLAPHVLDHADDRAVAVGGGALAHVEDALGATHAVLHLAAAVRGDLGRQPRELDEIGGLHRGGVEPGLHALAAQAPGLDEFPLQTGIRQSRAVGPERRQRGCKRRQSARAGRSRAGVIDEWAHHVEHRRIGVSA